MQDYLALTAVAIAAAYLAWSGWKFVASRKKATGCGSGCGSCSKNPTADGANDVVSIQLPTSTTTMPSNDSTQQAKASGPTWNFQKQR